MSDDSDEDDSDDDIDLEEGPELQVGGLQGFKGTRQRYSLVSQQDKMATVNRVVG